tara:strand:+ start:2583 stop:3536 length:954 start_codon:yes stop_codon:yes gene_type:complete
MKICVTGANGFIGSALCNHLSNQGHDVIGLVSSKKKTNEKKIKFFKVDFFKKKLDLSRILYRVECIIHCAAKAHDFDKNKNKLLKEIKKNNINLTQILAFQAKKNKVKKFIFISSIGVNGSFTMDKQRFKFNDKPNPSDGYSISKWNSEKFLKNSFYDTQTKLIIIRPPLVYGPGVKGNLLRLMKLLNLGIPLPLGSVYNQRSFVGLSNLLDFISVCMNHPKASNKTLLVSDNEDMTITEFIKKLSNSMNIKILLIPVPIFLLTFFGFLFFKNKEIKKLTTSLRVNSDFSFKNLCWRPKFSVNYEINKMTKWYLKQK